MDSFVLGSIILKFALAKGSYQSPVAGFCEKGDGLLRLITENQSYRSETNMNLCPVLMFLMLVGYRTFLYGSIVSVDREGNKGAKAFFAVLNPSLIMEFVFEIRVDNTVQPAYSGTPMTCACSHFREVCAKRRFFCIQCIYHE
jgi:hypothetical protein